MDWDLALVCPSRSSGCRSASSSLSVP